MKIATIVRLISERYEITENEVRTLAKSLAKDSSLSSREVYTAILTELNPAQHPQKPSSSGGLSKEENECGLCFEKIDRKNRLVRCPKCSIERCGECMIQNMRSNMCFPVCETPKCGTTFSKFILHRQLSKIKIKSLDPLIKESLWEMAKARLPEIASLVSQFGFRRTREQNKRKVNAKSEKRRLNTIKTDLQRRLVPYLKYVLDPEDGYGVKDLAQDLLTFPIRLTNITVESRYSSSGRHNAYLNYYTLKELESILAPFVKLPKNEDTLKILKNAIESYAKGLNPRLRELRALIPTLPDYVFVDIKGEVFNDNPRDPVDSGRGTNKHKTTFMFTCPRMNGEEKCPGFLSTRWKCMKCDGWTCKECHEPREEEEEHVCKVENIESAKFIMDNTRACPGCGARVQRSYGCNHMWCTECHTGFNYATGAIVADENNTNPHLHEWRVANGKASQRTEVANARPYQCDEEGDSVPPSLDLIKKCVGCGVTKEQMDTILDFRALIDPIRGNVGSLRNASDESIANEDYALEDYIAGVMSEEKVKEVIFRNHRKQERNFHNQAIRETLRVAGVDILASLMAVESNEAMSELVDSIYKLRDHINTSFMETSRILGYSTMSCIGSRFTFRNKVYVSVFCKKPKEIVGSHDEYSPYFYRNNYNDDYAAADAYHLILPSEREKYRNRRPSVWNPVPGRVTVVAERIITQGDFVSDEEWERSGNQT